MLNETDLYVKGRIFKPDGTPLDWSQTPPAERTLCLVNLGLWSIFKSATVVIGSNQYELTDTCFPYSSYIKTISWITPDMAVAEPLGFQMDYGGASGAGGWNNGAVARATWFLKAGPDGALEMRGRLPIDLFKTEPYLLPNTPLTVRLNRSDPEFYMLTTLDGKFRFNIEDIHLSGTSLDAVKDVRHKIAEIMTRTETAWEEVSEETGEPVTKRRKIKPEKANYRFESMVLRQFTIPAGNQFAMIPNVFKGTLPRKLLVGFVSQEAFAGNMKTNPYNFENIGVKSISLKVNGEPVETITTDFSKGVYTSAYVNFLKWADLEEKNSVIRKHQFPHGSTLFAFDTLKVCKGSDCKSEELMQRGGIEIVVELETQLTKPYIMLVFGIRASLLTLDQNRNAEMKNSTI
jgi:hypothetical protein